MASVIRLSKSEILDRLRACCRKLGRAPGEALFCKMSGVKEADVDYHWARFSDLVKESGETPQSWNVQIPESELFAEYAKVCQSLKKIPTTKELRIATRQLKTRTHRVKDRFGSMAEFDRRFRAWLEAQPEEYRQILGFPGWDRPRAPSEYADSQPRPVTSAGYSFHPYLPACLQNLDVLARGEVSPNEDPAQSVAALFERRCADAFRCLGFEITTLGQGKGRKADLLAIAPRERLALIVDAKVRCNEYVLGTEDRKFLEYAISHGRDLQARGFDRVYLVIVATSFRERDLDQLAAYLTDSPIRSVALLPVSVLMHFVEESIRERHAFTLSQLENKLFGNKIVSLANIK